MERKLIVLLILTLTACHKDQQKGTVATPQKSSIVTDNGRKIDFPDSVSASYFSVVSIHSSGLDIKFVSPGRVVATVVPSVESSGQNLVLFDNPELTTNYSSLLQHLIIIKTNAANVERIKDMAKNGAASGRDLIDAETALANERAGILEHEAKLKLAGLNPQTLLNAKPNSVWVICDVPETQLSALKTGASCQLQFSAFPQRNFMGKVEDWGDIVDPVTRMVKLRIAVNNPSNLLKAGMFATTVFETSNTNFLTAPKDAIITVQGKYYAFVKTSGRVFERREIQLGDQVQDAVIIYGGLNENENVVVKGTMQLKGLSFGY